MIQYQLDKYNTTIYYPAKSNYFTFVIIKQIVSLNNETSLKLLEYNFFFILLYFKDE